MRTKTLILAAVLVAAGVVSSQAQNVYSQNIVGYINTPLAGAGQLTLISNPFDDGNGNQATNLLSILPKSSSISLWNNVGANFASSITKSAAGWNGGLIVPPGTAMFVKNGGPSSPPLTNTFVGSIDSFTSSVALPAGFSMLGSYIPYSSADITTDTNVNLGTVLPKNTTLETWNSAGATYVSVTKSAAGWNGTLPLNAGQGLFISVKAATNVWNEVLSP